MEMHVCDKRDGVPLKRVARGLTTFLNICRNGFTHLTPRTMQNERVFGMCLVRRRPTKRLPSELAYAERTVSQSAATINVVMMFQLERWKDQCSRFSAAAGDLARITRTLVAVRPH